jgi:hypothetical protein
MIASILHSKSAIRLLPPDLVQPAIDAYAHSLSAVWFTASGVAVFTILASLFIQEKHVGGGKDKRETDTVGTGGGVIGDSGEGLGGGTVVRGDRQR